MYIRRRHMCSGCPNDTTSFLMWKVSVQSNARWIEGFLTMSVNISAALLRSVPLDDLLHVNLGAGTRCVDVVGSIEKVWLGHGRTSKPSTPYRISHPTTNRRCSVVLTLCCKSCAPQHAPVMAFQHVLCGRAASRCCSDSVLMPEDCRRLMTKGYKTLELPTWLGSDFREALCCLPIYTSVV